MHVAVLVLALTASAPATAADGVALPWWIWTIALFAVSFIIGIVAVLAGVGAGLLFALCGTLAAGPVLLRTGMANLRLVMPLALAGSIASLAGAVVGLSVATDLRQIALGAPVIAIALMIWAIKAADFGMVESDALGELLRLRGEFEDPAADMRIDWRTRRTAAGLAAFAAIGFFGGVFGLGAGFANVPALNLLMAAPMKVAVGSSG